MVSVPINASEKNELGCPVYYPNVGMCMWVFEFLSCSYQNYPFVKKKKKKGNKAPFFT